VSKRTVILAVALALVAAAAIGFVWRAPGRPSTWTDVRTWAGFGIVVVGAAIALIQMDMQRRQLASQQRVLEGEVERNKRRDVLLDGQLRELRDRELVQQRQQAERVDLELVDSTGDPAGASVFMGNVTNGSHRPVRDVACRIKPTEDRDAQLARTLGVLADWKLGGEVARRIMINPIEAEDGRSVPLVRAGITVAFSFVIGRREFPDATVTARFTDDAGLHWQVGHDLHLEKLADRDW
jgi:hypothetical protein